MAHLHSKLNPRSEDFRANVAAMRSLITWVTRAEKPTPESVAGRCAALEPSFEPLRGCRFRPDFTPMPLASRVPPR